ncbi:hypothetical protein [uncultured Shewanella sp.]|uniref:helix-turn-helix domain-containing protein n=1 Tax=uncultured Shewanella sp. TaxID=173975 RepID=UPI00260ADD47|nr:hypothetical protein [uncultured Shewanella sp.]
MPEVEQYDVARIKAIREQMHVSQTLTLIGRAAYLNASPSTIRQWEQGSKKHQSTSLKLLNLVANQGLDVGLILINTWH